MRFVIRSAQPVPAIGPSGQCFVSGEVHSPEQLNGPFSGEGRGLSTVAFAVRVVYVSGSNYIAIPGDRAGGIPMRTQLPAVI